MDAAADGAGRTNATAETLIELSRGLTITSKPSSPQRHGDLPKLTNYEIVPVADSFMEVKVTLSANPSNFMVGLCIWKINFILQHLLTQIQPYNDNLRLRDMMQQLKEYCENNDEFIPPDMVEIGQAYAAKNADGFYHRWVLICIKFFVIWHNLLFFLFFVRVIVKNKYIVEMIHVSFCDFGDIAILRSDQLKMLPAKFRKLPIMAIQAKLHGKF